MRRLLFVLPFVVVGVACGGTTEPAPSNGSADAGVAAEAGTSNGSSKADQPGGDASDAGTGADGSTRPPRLRDCTDGSPPTNAPTERWRRFRSHFIASLEPDHSARDTVTNSVSSVTLEGKFAYGGVSKDLESESVEVWIDDCSGGYRRLGRRRTDGDGRIRLQLSSSEVPRYGIYGLYFRVVGDNSAARATLRVLPKQTEFVVFDIDATLTRGNFELAESIVDDLFEPLKAGDYVPEARPGAVDATEVRRAKLGYQIVYLTARPYWLKHRTRAWLEQKGAAEGTLRMTRSTTEGLPLRSSVGEFKAEVLARLQAEGFEIEAAYGNSDTDIWAYEEAGLAKGATYVLGKHGGASGTIDLGSSFSPHVQSLTASGRPADQPFRYP